MIEQKFTEYIKNNVKRFDLFSKLAEISIKDGNLDAFINHMIYIYDHPRSKNTTKITLGKVLCGAIESFKDERR